MISLQDWFNLRIKKLILIIAAALTILTLSFLLLFHKKSVTDLEAQTQISLSILQSATKTQNHPLAEMALNQIHLQRKSSFTALCRNKETVLSINAGFDACGLKQFWGQKLYLVGNNDLYVLISQSSLAFDNLTVAATLLVCVIISLIYWAFRTLYKTITRDILSPIIDDTKFSPIQEIDDYKTQQENLIKLRQARSAAEAHFKLSKQVAHDIRSPLSALNMVVSVLHEAPEDKKAIIKNATSRINDIARDLLNKAKYATSNPEESKETDSKLNQFCLKSLVVAMLEEKRLEYCNNANVTFKLDTQANFNAVLKGSSQELARAISNIINNSIESFENNEGIVTTSMHTYDGTVELSIKDTGKGIPKDILLKLGQNEVSRGKNGNGLGVYHAKKTIEALNGRFSIQSEIGIGTSVQMSIPLTR